MAALYWHKRDFRFFDNAVLNWLNEVSTPFVACYIWEPSLLATYEMAEMHQFAVLQAIDSVRGRYQRQNVPFIEEFGEVVETVDRIRREFAFDTLVSHMEHGTQATFERDLALKAWCAENGMRWVEFPSCTVKRALRSRDDREKIWNAHMAERLLPVPKELVGADVASRTSAGAENLRSEIIAKGFDSTLQPVSERAAHETLQDFLNERGREYRGGISSPNTALKRGSRLSVHLAWGTISLRCVYRTTKQKMFELQNPMPDGKPTAEHRRHYASLKSFSARLHWRDHFIQRIEDEPMLPHRTLSPAFQNIEFVREEERLWAWLEGRTGEPLIDACMRCLRATGFINFRMRSMCISYAVYGLHLDWRVLGEELAKLFYDYEPGIHWSQVQMQAGVVGINTIRVYSPEKQLLDQDPECVFVKTWIPELRGRTPEEIKSYNTLLGDLAPYPRPIVPFKEQAAAMKKVIYGIKGGAENRAVKAEVARKHGSRTFRSAARKRKSTEGV